MQLKRTNQVARFPNALNATTHCSQQVGRHMRYYGESVKVFVKRKFRREKRHGTLFLDLVNIVSMLIIKFDYFEIIVIVNFKYFHMELVLKNICPNLFVAQYLCKYYCDKYV